ncbi:MAG TPA: hypothetical protein VLH40_07440 [Atribacteraceae bacterium]|nr:hypothetical protein [Atribacteraceae bacterium]
MEKMRGMTRVDRERLPRDEYVQALILFKMLYVLSSEPVTPPRDSLMINQPEGMDRPGQAGNDTPDSMDSRTE